MDEVEGERLVRMRRRLAEEGLDALVCRLPENVLCLTGYWPLSGVSFLMLPRDGDPLVIAPATEAEAGLLPCGVAYAVFPWGRVSDPAPLASVRGLLAGRRFSRLGWEGDFEAVAPAHVAGEVLVPAHSTAAMLQEAFPGAVLADATALLSRERAVKMPRDIDGLRRVAAVAERGVLAFEASVRPGVTEAEVVAAVEGAVVREGLGLGSVRSVRGFAQVLSGPRTAAAWGPAYLATQRRVETGELVLLELATVADGYWSDVTRVRVAGSPTGRQRAVRAAVDAAVRAATAAARPGVEGAAVDAAARTSLAEAGLDTSFPHHTGHGVGFRYHEPIPWLHPRSPDVLEEGMVCTIEPGVYSEDFGGVRVEENVIVGPAGSERLSVPARGWE